MTIPDVKQYVGRSCAVTWRDRSGAEQSKVLRIHDVLFVPLYGAYLVGDLEDVCLTKITSIQPID